MLDGDRMKNNLNLKSNSAQVVLDALRKKGIKVRKPKFGRDAFGRLGGVKEGDVTPPGAEEIK